MNVLAFKHSNFSLVRTELRQNGTNFINKKWRKRTKQMDTSATLTKQWLSIIQYLQNEQKPCHANLSYQIFTISQEDRKMVNYYLLQ